MHVLNAVDPNEETGSTPTQMPSIKWQWSAEFDNGNPDKPRTNCQFVTAGQKEYLQETCEQTTNRKGTIASDGGSTLQAPFWNNRVFFSSTE